ncbi:adenine deaminase [Conoideocrella luteorostrata]|uniref:Adenine deaminase n=1 Tax=Conoideocrella luteorostrata TaxID=1105319 RepID=A0AAJ0CYK4_9HYPO|nr:adenine deaminase [Conoideocrella luteorostrata]
MCKSVLHAFLHELPKCEHHVHIEGTLSPEVLFSLAEQNGIQLTSDDPALASPDTLRRRYENFASLDDFLHYFFIGCSVLLTSSDFELLTYSHLEKLHAQEVRHVEFSFDPQVHVARGVSYETIVSGLTTARTRAAHDFPDMSIAFIPCLVRHLPKNSALELVSDLLDLGYFADGTLAGFGMTSTEIGMHPSGFSTVYKALREAGIERLTAHYGEEGPAEYVEAAISDLGLTRIDHGRRASEDAALLGRLAGAGTMLTMCPISNVVLKGVGSIRDLPVRDFLTAGVRFSINTDDPAYCGAGLLDNYCAIQEAFDLSIEEWEFIASGAIEGSWCSQDRKQYLKTMLNLVVGKWKNGRQEG